MSQALRTLLGPGGRNGQLGRHTGPNSVVKGTHADGAPGVPGPVLDALGLSERRNENGSPGVPGLLGPRRPAAVRRLVVPMVVDSVNREPVSVSVGVRPIPEDGEGYPFGTHGDSSPTVAHEVPVLRVATTGEHAGPNGKERRSAPAVVAPATAGERWSTGCDQRFPVDLPNGPAVAFAHVCNAMPQTRAVNGLVRNADRLKYRPTSTPLSNGDVFNALHNHNVSTVSQ